MDEATARDSLPYNTYIARGLLKESGENFMDYKDCFNWFRSLVEQYQLFPLMCGYDRYSAQYLVQTMEAYGFHMDSVYQGTANALFTAAVIERTDSLRCGEATAVETVHRTVSKSRLSNPMSSLTTKKTVT